MRYLVSVFLFLLISIPALAIEVEYFNFTNSKTYALTDDALLDNSLINNKYPWMFTAALDHVKTPLSIQRDSERTDDIVRSLQGLHLGGGVRLIESLFIGAKTYIANIDTDSDGAYWGDSTIEAKWRVWQGENSALAIAPAVYVPTGTQGFTTDGNKVGEYLGLNFEKNFKWIQISIMGGYSNKPGATFSYGPNYTSLDYKKSVYTAIGSVIPFTDTWALNIEGYRYNQLNGNQHPNEMYVGLRNQTTPSLSAFFGASFGGLIDQTSNDYRVSAGIKYTPFAEPKTAPVPAPIASPEPVKKPVTKREVGLEKEKALYGTLVAGETIYFANGSSKLDTLSQDIAQKFNNTVSKLENAKIEYTIVLEGFASRVGNPVRNMALSKERIKKTETTLANLGINSNSIVEVAYGDSTVDTTVSEALNRKVMLRLYRK